MAQEPTLGSETFETALSKVLNTHGYGFQYAVIQRAYELSKGETTYWDHVVSEFPVATPGGETRIDFVLKRRHQDAYLVAECKRANPATSTWCFVRAPRIGTSSSGRQIHVESMFPDKQLGLLSGGEQLCWSDKCYGLGFELRSGKVGDSGGQSRGLIEEAAGQAMRSVNGLVEFFKRRRILLTPETKTMILPAIFTTAELYVSDVDLRQADLHSGELARDAVGLESIDWLWLDYRQSPSLKHSATAGHGMNSIADTLHAEYARAVAVVSPKGIESFLSWEWS